LKLATWNVNSLKVRLPHLLGWLAADPPDIVCLQETKTEDAKFPSAEIEAAGYHVAWSGQKTYNGVAIVSRKPVTEVSYGIAGFADEQKRVIAATKDSVRVIDAYVPNGQSVVSDKFRYKLDWLNAFTGYLEEQLAQYPELAVVGDFNIAPESRDVHDPKAWEGQVLCSDAERDAFNGLLGLGLVDSFRLFEQPEKSYTWWDYRLNAFKRNMGLRIDHILLSPALAKRCWSVSILKDIRAQERPSDHAPVVADIGES